MSTSKEQHFDFDYFVMGAGSGGLASAKRAAQHGAKVAVAEADRVGGTCVIRGCVPKKLMYTAAQLGRDSQLASAYGWPGFSEPLNWETLVRGRNAMVASLEKSHRAHLEKAGVHLFTDRAVVTDPHTVRVAGQNVTAQHILVATGSSPVMPDIDGADCCMTSDGFFKLARMPRSAVLVGGSYIATELSSILQALGCETTLAVRSCLLRGFDRDVQTAVEAAMRQHGIDIRMPARVTKVELTGKSARVTIQGEDRVSAMATDACVLFATGRTPNSAGLGLEAVGVRIASSGAVQVDEHHTTAVPSIHAIGDVIDKVNLTPVAIRAGRILADRLFAQGEAVMRYDTIPTAVFSLPPVGTVGLTEGEARRTLGDAGVRIYRTSFAPLGQSPLPPESRVRSMVKMVVDAASDKVLGIHMVGEHAPEIIQGFAVAVRAGLKKADFDATVAMHPTQAEELVLMR